MGQFAILYLVSRDALATDQLSWQNFMKIVTQMEHSLYASFLWHN